MLIILVLILAFLLRLYNINQSLWLDEAINVVAARDYGFKKLITEYALGDYHPPIYHLFLKFWISIFGDSEIAVRMPSVIFGVMTVYVSYLIGKKLVNKNFGLLSAIFVSLGPYNIYFSQEARMYCLEGLLGSLAVYFFIKILKKEAVKSWAGFIVAISLAFYTDYFGFFLPFIFLGYSIIYRKRKIFKKVIIASFISFIPWLLWLPLFFKQFKNALSTAEKIPGWAEVVGSSSLKNLGLTVVKFSIGRIHFYNKLLYGLGVVPVLVFFAFLFLRSGKVFKKKKFIFLLCWGLIPVILSFLISFLVPIYQPFRLLYVLPCFYIFLAGGVFSFERKKRIIFGLIVILISVTGLSIYYYDKRFHRENWRGAVAAVEKRAKKGDLVVFVSYKPMKPWVYYQKKNLVAVGAGQIEKIAKAERVFLFRYLWPVFDPEDLVKKNIEKKFRVVDEKDFNGVLWQLYE